MIDSAKIDLLGDVFEIFSLECDEKIPEEMKTNTEIIRVFLAPSLTADFSVKAYFGAKEEYCDYCAAALIAAAFLVIKRGLPLSDMVFETPRGNITIFHTGAGKFRAKVDKCKLLLSSKLEHSGCDIEYIDIFLGGIIRAIHTDDPDLFKTEKLRELVTTSSAFPSAVILSSSNGDKLKMSSYMDFSLAHISNFSLWCCAAYNEKNAKTTVGKFLSEEYNSVFEVYPSSVIAEVHPNIL